MEKLPIQVPHPREHAVVQGVPARSDGAADEDRQDKEEGEFKRQN